MDSVSNLKPRTEFVAQRQEHGIEAGDIHGWHSFDQSLLKAYEAADITDETAVLFATHKTKMRRDIEMMNKMRYDYAEESSGLQMATDQ